MWPDIEQAAQRIEDSKQIRKLTEKWYRCASLVMAFACDRYWTFDLKYEPKLSWEGLMHDPTKIAAAGMKSGDKIPDGDLFRMLLGNMTVATNKTQLKELLKVASMFLDTIDVDKHDTRSLRVHFLEFACNKPCEDGPYSIDLDQSAWRPQCLTEKLRKSVWYRASGMEYSSDDLWGLCA